MKKPKKYRESIENKIKRANFKEALNELEDFIKVINDKDLNIQILTLHARFNSEFKRYLSGLTKNLEEQNKIIYALTHLLEEAEEIAKEKISKIEEEKYFHRDYRNMLIDEFKKYLDLQELLDKTEDAREKFNTEETFGKSAARELFVALGMKEGEAIDQFSLSEDRELIKKYKHLVKKKN